MTDTPNSQGSGLVQSSSSLHGDPARPAGHPSLVLLGINHHTAPLEVRERLAIAAARLPDALRALHQTPGVHESMILSTCNRVELLTLQADHGTQHGPLLTFLNQYFSLPHNLLQPHLYELRGEQAIRHLFRVASSLDSMIVGEPQILGQVKDAWNAARDAGAIQPGTGNARYSLDTLLQRAFAVAKRVRTETEIGSSSVSIASVAVDLARKIFGSLQGKQVLLVGAGKMAELALRHLVAQGASSVLIANRTATRAQAILDRLATPVQSAATIPWDNLAVEAHRADIIVTSTGASALGGPAHLFTPEQGRALVARRRGHPVFFIDIAVPRDVHPAVNNVDGCFVYDIDDLQQVAATHLSNRSREAAAAEAIVAEEVARFHERLQSLDRVPAIRALQDSAEQIRQAELARIAPKLASLTPAQQDAVEALTRALTNKLLHPQLVALRQPRREQDQ